MKESRLKEIIYFHEHPSEHLDSDFCCDDGEEQYIVLRLRDVESELRRLMWLSHNHSGIYGDDGEMQCGECAKFGCWDYKHAPLDDVRKAYSAACLERVALSGTPENMV